MKGGRNTSGAEAIAHLTARARSRCFFLAAGRSLAEQPTRARDEHRPVSPKHQGWVKRFRFSHAKRNFNEFLPLNSRELMKHSQTKLRVVAYFGDLLCVLCVPLRLGGQKWSKSNITAESQRAAELN